MKRKLRGVFQGLRGRLTGSFVLVIVISIGLVAMGAQMLTLPRLDETAQLANRRHAFRLAPFFVEGFRQNNSWQDAGEQVAGYSHPLPPELVAGVLSYFPQRPTILGALNEDRLILLDATGRVAADSQGRQLVGELLPVEMREQAVPLTDGDMVIGYLLVESGLERAVGEVVLTILRRTMLVTALVAALVALPVSFWLAYRLSRPLQQLSQAAQQLGRGETNAPLPVESTDEIGELTGSFNAMTAALEEQKRLRRQMVADIAHELRTPLSVMQLDIEGLADGLQNPSEAAASLRNELETLNRLIEDLRLLSLADAGGLQFELDELALPPFLQWVAATWQSKMQGQHVQLVTDIPAKLPLIYADEQRLAQVLHNLLSNALRYTPPGGRISLGAQGGQAGVQLWVADSGPGITAEDLPYVFERFYRADQSRSRDTGGSGLGLAIAKQWVLLHGGRIWAENGPDGGAQFSVSLPAASK